MTFDAPKFLRRCLALVLLLPGCMTCPWGEANGAWRHRVLWEGDEKVQSVAIGEVVPERSGLEVVGTDAAGRVIMISPVAESSEATVVYEHGCKLTGLLIADLDPTVSGAEIYVGGYDTAETGGEVVQLRWSGSGIRSRTVWVGNGFVHGLAHLDAGPALVITTYTGEVHLATPTAGGGAWASRLLHREPDSGDPEALKIKDVVAGPIGGASRSRIFIAVKSGRGVLLDPQMLPVATVLHTEADGIARLALEPSGDLLLAGNLGRVVRLTLESGRWRASTLFQETDNLRGIATGRFRTPDQWSSVAVFGYPGLCRLLLGENGTSDPRTIYDDQDRGHWLVAGDILPDNDSDELVLAGYSGRIVMTYRSDP